MGKIAVDMKNDRKPCDGCLWYLDWFCICRNPKSKQCGQTCDRCELYKEVNENG